jgi:hypothetical protein
MILRPQDWADMASYFLPTTTITGLYIAEGGEWDGAVGCAILMIALIMMLHLLRNRG